MKKGRLVAIINENSEKSYLTNMNEDSFYDGYKFVEYGKNIENISLLLPSSETEDYAIDKDKVVINWGAKFEFRNSGIEGVQITVLSLQAPIIATGGEAGSREVEVNYAEYNFNVVKEKIVESQDVQIFVSAIEVDVETKTVNVIVSI
jgi:hypothetical protein